MLPRQMVLVASKSKQEIVETDLRNLEAAQLSELSEGLRIQPVTLVDFKAKWCGNIWCRPLIPSTEASNMYYCSSTLKMYRIT